MLTGNMSNVCLTCHTEQMHLSVDETGSRANKAASLRIQLLHYFGVHKYLCVHFTAEVTVGVHSKKRTLL